VYAINSLPNIDTDYILVALTAFAVLCSLLSIEFHIFQVFLGFLTTLQFSHFLDIIVLFPQISLYQYWDDGGINDLALCGF
jgi:hypothetical protein